MTTAAVSFKVLLVARSGTRNAASVAANPYGEYNPTKVSFPAVNALTINSSEPKGETS
jgi:hypothetical protein